MIRNCDVCKKEYEVRPVDLKRGWGYCCSKSCGAIRWRHKGTLAIYNQLKSDFKDLVDVVSECPFTLNIAILCTCKQHGEFKTSIGSAKKRNHLCPKCAVKIANQLKASERYGIYIDDKSKQCLGCNKVLPRELFRSYKGNKSNSRCNECQKEFKNKISIPYNSDRRAKKKKLFIEKIDRMKVFQRDNWKCCICNATVKIGKCKASERATIDHIIPLKLGGFHSYSNVQTLCKSCNCSKGGRYDGQMILGI